MWLFYYFTLERNYGVLKWKSPCILLNKSINFNKNEIESKTENSTQVSERRTLCFSSYKNRKLKVNLWWVGVCERKKLASFVPFFFTQRKFFLTFVFYLYWIYFQNIHTFTYQKTLLYKLFCLFLKFVKSLQCILKKYLRNVWATLTYFIRSLEKHYYCWEFCEFSGQYVTDIYSLVCWQTVVWANLFKKIESSFLKK